MIRINKFLNAEEVNSEDISHTENHKGMLDQVTKKTSDQILQY